MPPPPPAAAPRPDALAPEVRPAHPLDPDALAMIAGSEAELAALYPPEVRHAFSPRQLVDAGVAFFVARIDSRPVGCGGIAPCDGYGELKRIYTDPALRGRGVAAAVIAALEAEARRRGLPLARLETGKDSPEALWLYRRLGYVARGPFGAYRENGSSVFMEKRLSPEATSEALSPEATSEALSPEATSEALSPEATSGAPSPDALDAGKASAPAPDPASDPAA